MPRFKIVLVAVSLTIFSLLAAPGLTQAQAQITECRTLTDAQVADLFVQWNQALVARDLNRIVALYATDATLLPTVQNGPMVGRSAISGYFKVFLTDEPKGTIDRRVIKHGCNIAYDIGLYTFTYPRKPPTKARYTYIYKYDPDEKKWVIAHHHSSKQPQ